MNNSKAALSALSLIFLISLSFPADSQVNPQMKAVLDKAIATAKTSGLYAKKVKWDSIQEEMYHSATEAKTVQELKRSFEVLFLAMKDKNAEVVDPATKMRIAGYPVYQDQEMQTGTLSTEVTFAYQMLDNNIAYLRLVQPAPGTDIAVVAAQVRAAIDSLSKQDAQWIVDLRFLTNGDIPSAFAGIGPLLGEGLVATSAAGKDIRDLYSVHNGKFYDNDHLIVSLPSWTKDMRNIRIAVLVGKQTSGAGELLAIALKGRRNTRLFGATTAGKTTGMTTTAVSTNADMTISTTTYGDRNGTFYPNALRPEVPLEYTPSLNPENDDAVAAAKAWLTAVDKSAKVATR